MSNERRQPVVLAELWERTSGQGSTYFSGYMGRTKVLLLAAGEREHRGEMVKVWNLCVVEQESRERHGNR